MIDELLRTVRVERAARGPGGNVARQSVARPEALSLSLSEVAGGDAPPRATATTPLTPGQARKLLAPLSAVAADGGDRPEEASGVLPPPPPSAPVRPRNAAWIPILASAAGTAPVVTGSGKLEVVRQFPVADAAVAPYLSVTFSQPMIAAASHADLSPEQVPVKLVPAIPGRWRWLGTDTLLFEAGADGNRRLPLATAYHARVAAGTVSVSGGVLAEEAVWMFDTPAPTLRKHPLYRRRSYGRQPVLFAAFDQRIDPTAVARHVRVLSEGGRAYATRLATDAEVAADPLVMRLVEATPPGYWLAVVPEEPLPTVLTMMLSFVQGTPSAEGPLVAMSAQGFRFGVRGPLQLSSHWFDGDECTPSGDWTLTFSNDLDPLAFEPVFISISPELDEATFTLFRHTDYADSWTGIRISGRKRPGTDYMVTVHAGLTDVFGQKLEKDVSVSFSVGGLPPRLDTVRKALTVLDACEAPVLPIHTTNLGTVLVRAYRVVPGQYPAYLRWRSAWPSDPDRQEPPGVRVLNDILGIDGSPDTQTETAIHLGTLLGDAPGHLIVQVRAVSALTRISDAQVRQLWRSSTVTWIQATRLGLDLFVDRREVLIWISRLSDGAPCGGVSVEPGTPDVRGVSDGTGAVRLPLPVRAGNLVIARAGYDTAFLPVEAAPPPNNTEDDRIRATTVARQRARSGQPARPLHDAGGTEEAAAARGEAAHREYPRSEQDHDVRISAFSDRTLCHPGETVGIKGWLRRVGRGPCGDVSLFDATAATRIEYRVIDVSGSRAIVEGRAPLSPVGGFHFRFNLPQEVDRGWATIYLRTAGGTLESHAERHAHRILVADSRRLECEVAVQVSLVPDSAGGRAEATVTAAYGNGRPLAAAEVEWSVTATADRFRPSGWTGYDVLRSHRAGFTFGVVPPWWLIEDDRRGEWGADEFRLHVADVEGPAPGRSDPPKAVFRSRTDAGGCHRLRIDFASGVGTCPVRIDATATVFDRNRKVASRSAPLLVQADRYVGLRSPDNFVQLGERFVVEVAVVGQHGDAVAGHRAVLRAARLEWEQHGDEWRETERDVQERTVVTATDPALDAGPAHGDRFTSCTFETPRPGRYRITATVVDAAGRRHRTELTRWVSGAQRLPRGSGEQHEVTLVPNRDRYLPGESAAILVQASFVPAEGMLTLRRDGLVSSERFSMHGPACVLHVPIEERFVPNLHVQVDLVGAVAPMAAVDTELPNAPRRPAWASGSLNLPIEPLNYSLKVAVAAKRECLEPGAATSIDVWVSDAGGTPVIDAELAVVVVDDAALVAGWRLPDLISDFHHERYGGVGDYHNRTCILAAQQTVSLSAPDTRHDDKRERADRMSGGGLQDSSPPILFAPELRTNARGKAQVTVTAPDRVARYRVLAVAAAGERQFGIGEANLTVRRGLTMRLAAPRFVNLGDRFDLAATVSNEIGGTAGVQVAARADNAELTAHDGESVAGYRVNLSPEERVEIRFPAAPGTAGNACFRFRAAVVSGSPGTTDAVATVELPVLPPAITETLAVCGEIDSGGAVRWPVRWPRSALPGHGGLAVSLSATALTTLTDAFLHVWRRPRVCSEQIASRILAAAALHDVLPAFATDEFPAPHVIDATMQQDLKALQILQHHEGGFPIWERNGEMWPYHSVHAAHALARAHRSACPVPDVMIERSLNYLRNIENDIDRQRYSLPTLRPLKAYALYVRTLLDDPDTAAAAWLVDAGLEHLTAESVGWLLFVLAADPAREQSVGKVLDFLGNPVGAAHVTSEYEHLLLHSEARTDAVLLETLVAVQPDNGMIARLADSLLARRVEGRWDTTQENVWALLALRRYFDTLESVPPDFEARVWLGEGYVGGHEFRALSPEPARIVVPLANLQAGSANVHREAPLTVQQEGEGRLYYRLCLHYASSVTGLARMDRGFAVMRSYGAVDDPADARRDRDGIWRVKAGSRILVKLTLTAPARRTHVVLIDPLPAGLEPLGPAPVDLGEPPARWWEPPWYEHHELSDTRAEAFTSLLPGGVYEFRYLARAATVGTFTASPARVEALYSPNIFGRTAIDRVIVG